MNKILYILFFGTLLLSCREEQTPNMPSPSQRNKESIENLRKDLVKAPYGWKVTYFPKTDSLLFTDKDQVIEKDSYYKSKYGYGGYSFAMKFNENGEVQMLVDTDANTAKTIKSSEFLVRQNTFTQLSFITPNYIHRLVNEKEDGKSDFLYVGKNIDGNLVFRTSSHIEPAKEYIVFEKLTSEEDWLTHTQKSLENRKIFDNIENPQITIRKGSRVYFQSDVVIKTRDNQRFVDEIQKKRFYLFRFAKKPNPDPSSIDPIESTGLGSGYVGTDKGISFRAGIRYSKNYIFYDFEKVGDTFVAELVKVYDPILKKNRLVSKHLAPANYEPTGYIAEIKNVNR